MTATVETASETPVVLKARAAGGLYVISVVTAVTGEFVAKGKLGFFAGVVVPIACYAAVTLLLYGILRVVNRRLAWVALAFGLAGLACEALQLQSRGVNLGMVFHGFFCVLTGFLIMRARFLPHVLGALMAQGGLVWLLDLLPELARHVSPFNTMAGLAGEGLPMLWLLAMGVNAEKWQEQAAACVKKPGSPAQVKPGPMP